MERKSSIRKDGLLQKLGNHRELSLLVFIIFLLLIFLITSPSLLKPSNLTTILLNSITIAILAFGEIVVIVGRGIDLSVGANMGIVTLVVGKLALMGMPIWAVVLIAILVGLVAGAINGCLVSLFKLPPIIVTLGTLSVYSGIMFVVTNGQWTTNLPNQLLMIGSGRLFGIIPAPVVALFVLLILMIAFLQFSIVGRHVYAVGNNPDAARLAGVRNNRIIFMTYVIAGLLAAIAGIYYVAYNGFSTPTTGANVQLDAIAAAVIGGTNVFGGRGTPVGGLLGAILLGVITQALVFYHLPAVWNQAAEGLIILIAVISDSTLSKRTNLGRGRLGV